MDAIAGVHIDPRFQPVYVVSFTPRPAVDAYLTALTKIIKTGKQYAVLFDASRSASPSDLLGNEQAAWIRAHRDEVRRLCLGSAFILMSPIARVFFSALTWLRPLPCPHITCETKAEAVLWVGERLQKAGIQIPLGLLGSGVVGN